VRARTASRSPGSGTRTRALIFGALLAALPLSLAGQDSPWNDARVLELVGRARTLRSAAVVDSSFQSYQATARGYVYFFFDRPDRPERTLVKADQVALDVYWQAPSSTKQMIVGQRDEKLLPTDIRYHLDHLTVVQDDFGDAMRMGDGDEVEAVVHPVAAGSEGVYDFQLVDSLSIRYAGGTEEIRVYQVRVRPRDFERPGFVGTIYLDRASAAIVRMSFSFTPASYVDPYLDYIRVSLDNSLWLGRHWLPYRQEVEIRREIPVLDVMTGSVIRGRFDVGNYEFNTALPLSLFAGPRVSAASPAQRAAFQFERGLLDDIEREGLVVPPALEEVRNEVAQVVENRMMSGLDSWRVHFATLSEAARYNRGEGLRIGGGVTLRPNGNLTTRIAAGYSFGRREPSGSLAITRSGAGRVQPTLEAYWDQLGDVGGYPGASLLENTISTASGDKDYTDPFFRRGATLTLHGNGDPGGFSVGFRWEEHVSAADVISDDPSDTELRPVLSVDEGTLGALVVHAPIGAPGGGRAALTGELGRLGGRTFGTASGEILWELRSNERRWHGEVSVGGGAVTSRAPAQSLTFLGGRWTLPGHDYRAFAGERYGLLRAETTYPIVWPYVGVRAIGAVGATYLGARNLPADWVVKDSNGVRGSVGAGLSFGFDAMRVDVARGLGRGGGWEALFSVARQFRAWL
jgi:hypothetical protein